MARPMRAPLHRLGAQGRKRVVWCRNRSIRAYRAIRVRPAMTVTWIVSMPVAAAGAAHSGVMRTSEKPKPPREMSQANIHAAEMTTVAIAARIAAVWFARAIMATAPIHPPQPVQARTAGIHVVRASMTATHAPMVASRAQAGQVGAGAHATAAIMVVADAAQTAIMLRRL